MATTTQLTILDMILLISIPGAFGGFCFALYDFYRDAKLLDDYVVECLRSDNLKKSHICLWLLGKAAIGVAGAWGIVLIGFGVGKIQSDNNVLNQVFLIAFSSIGGTLSYTMLPNIGNKVANELQLKIEKTQSDFQSKIENTIKEIRLVHKESIEGDEFGIAMNEAVAALNTRSKFDAGLAIQKLEKIKEKHPTVRTLHIYLGRLYRIIRDYNKAIQALRDFINYLENECSHGNVNPERDHDMADAYYNISCYKVLMAKIQEKPSPEEKERLLSESIKALKKSIALSPSNLENAKIDDDLHFLRSDKAYKDEFKKLGS